MSKLRSDLSVAQLNRDAEGCLPGYLAVEFLTLTQGRATSRMPIHPFHLAPNHRLHAGAIVTLADTTCGHATMAHLPEGASSFATIELKSNHLGTVTQGAIACVATALYLGEDTQVWDAEVTDEPSGRTLALFRCTQIILRETEK